MYDQQQLAKLRTHPDRLRILAAILDAHDALAHPTETSIEVVSRIRNGQLEVLFDDAIPPVGGLAPGENPIILGGQGMMDNPFMTADQVHSLVLSILHEGVHHLDVVSGRVSAGSAATVEQRFFTELHAYTAEYELARRNRISHLRRNRISHLLGPEFRGARHLDDLSAAVLTVESYLVLALSRLPGVEDGVVQRVGSMFPDVPGRIP